MKALSFTNPYGMLVVLNEKRFETRSRPLWYRGPLAIHSSKIFPWVARETCGEWPYHQVFLKHGIRGYQDLPRQAIIGMARMVDCERSEVLLESGMLSDQEIAFGNFGAERFGYKMIDVLRLPEPVYCKGKLGIWTVPDDVVAKIRCQVTLPDRYFV